MTTDELDISLEPVGSDLESCEADWSSLESSIPGAPPYLTFNWLTSWAAVYQPSRLHVVRIHSGDGDELVAIGLVEQLSLRRLRFAGAPVTPIRGLLCRQGFDERAWRALDGWLHGQSRFAWLQARGVEQHIPGLRRTVSTLEPWMAIELPVSFDAYLRQRPSSRRREYRRRLRTVERVGAAVRAVPAEEVHGALTTFKRLHLDRARTKGEHHASIDDQLVAMLDHLGSAPAPELRLFALEQGSEVLAVAVDIDHGGQRWGYNTGFSPDASRLSPGLIVRLGSIAEAIERGCRRFDCGPGDYLYKRELGAERCDRLRVEACASSVAGTAWLLASASQARLRQVGWVRRGFEATQSARARASG